MTLTSRFVSFASAAVIATLLIANKPLLAEPGMDPVAQKQASDVLSLISVDHTLADKQFTRSYKAEAFLELVRSTDRSVRQVAAMGMRVAADNHMAHVAFIARKAAVGDLLGAGSSDSPPPPISARVTEALADPGIASELAPFQPLARWRPLLESLNGTSDNRVMSVAKATANYYVTELFLLREQSILWQNAADLAKRATAGGSARGPEVRVHGQFEPDEDFGEVVLSNPSRADVRNLTILLTLWPKPVDKESEAAYAAIGGLAGQLSGSDRPEDQEAVGRWTVMGGKADEAIKSLPIRAFVHLPLLPAGQRCRFNFVPPSVDINGSADARYSMWADGIESINQTVPGYDEALRHAKEDAASGDPQAARRRRWMQANQDDPAGAEEKAQSVLKEGIRQLLLEHESTAHMKFEWVLERYPGTKAASEAQPLLHDTKQSYEEKLRVAQPPPKPLSAAKPYLGSWNALGAERMEGQTSVSLAWNIHDDGTILETIPALEGGSPSTWHYTLDTSKTPWQIDLTSDVGTLRGKVLHAIMSVDGDTLTICMPDSNAPANVKRPASFDVSNRDDIRIIRFRRTK